MSERKVLNKYYPPDYDASKIPRVKREKNRQFTIRLMVPFNIRCKTCGEYIYRGKKFNARKEDVIGKTYLGIQIYRFYIKCTKCLAEITFLTDPENQDYAMENGAIRNFESLRLAEKQAENEAKAKAEAEENNPMQVLENRTRDSRREMDMLETLEDLRERNTANLSGVDPKILQKAEEEYKKQLELLEKEEDEAEIKKMFANKYAAEEFVEEVVTSKLKAETNNNKKSKSQNDEEECSLSKKIKIEATEEPERPKQLTALFKKTLPDPSTVKPLVGQLKKNNINSFIKKKPVEIKTEPSVEVLPVTENVKNTEESGSCAVTDRADKPVANSLLNMMSSYADSDDSRSSD